MLPYTNTLPVTASTTPSGMDQDTTAKSSSVPPWVLYLIPGYGIAIILIYFWAASTLARFIDARRRKQQVLLMRQQRPEWELYP